MPRLTTQVRRMFVALAVTSALGLTAAMPATFSTTAAVAVALPRPPVLLAAGLGAERVGWRALPRLDDPVPTRRTAVHSTSGAATSLQWSRTPMNM
jgi:hypothetical protein